MLSGITFDGRLPFRIQRPTPIFGGFVSDVDATIEAQLKKLNEELGKRILDQNVNMADKILLLKPLTPQQIPDKWEPGSLIYDFNSSQEVAGKITLSEYVVRTPNLSKLKFQFRRNLSDILSNLDFNAKAVLDDSYAAISDYLIAYAFHIGDRQEIDGLTDFILNDTNGAKNVVNYAIVSAARTMIDNEKLIVPNYNDDNSPFVATLKNTAGLLLSSISFKTSVSAVIKNFIFNANEAGLIEQAVQAGIATISPEMKPLLIKYIQHSPVPITPANVNYFLPLFISQIKGTTEIGDSTEVDTVESDKDFDVQLLEDDNSLIKISKSAVKCAAQLYYGMVLGEELDVFNVVNYFTHKYLIRGEIEIQDSRLREDLQMYVFSDKFTDLKTKKIVDRTRPAERQMFYRQVFNEGKAQITNDLIVNKQFTRLWKVLILESANYLERARESFYPQNYVSKNNVMQAVEDLQYNLSTHCTGMANVITPLIYAELDFVIRRIFMHSEILRQIVPQGGTWWRVVEKLYMDMKNMRPKATVLYNKAKLGNEIIRSIADYNPASFEDDKNFSSFISSVDAFITTQSILQEALTDDLKKGEEEEEVGQNGSRRPVPKTVDAAVPNAKPVNNENEWDF